VFVKSVLRSSATAIAAEPEICRIAQHIVSESMACCASICVAVSRSDGWQFQSGTAGRLDKRSRGAVSPDTPFDLASLTKPVVALTAATLASRRSIRLSGSIASYLPELARSPMATTTMEQLLSHRSGLRPHLELFAPLRAGRAVNVAQLLEKLERLGWRSQARTQERSSDHAIYSDLGYMLVGIAIERHLRTPLDQVVADSLGRELRVPIGSSRQWREAVKDFHAIVAPTEYVAWRGGAVRGQVHDENAWAIAGYGLAGHAGLFGTAPGVARFGCAVLDALAGNSSPIDGFAAHYCTARRSGGTLQAGFDGKSECGSSAGSLLSPYSFGHLGFTGTSLWCDPENRLVIALLTNRVYPTPQNPRLTAARPYLHDSLVRATRTAGVGHG